MSNADLWSNLMTGTFALGGALLGFLGSWLTATKASEAAKRQTQQDRIHERRDEAISESYAQILSLDDAYLKMVRQSRSSGKESKHKEVDQVLDTVRDWLPHFRKNQPWIPEVVANKMVHVVDAYQKRALDFRESLGEASEAKLPDVMADEDSELKAMKEEVDFDNLRFHIRAALGIEEPDIDFTLSLLGMTGPRYSYQPL